MLAMYLAMVDDPGAQAKITELYVSYRQMMYYVAYRILKNKEDAEDVVQSAFMRAIDHLDDIDENDVQRTKAYLAIITQNLAYDTYRVNKRERTRRISFDEFEMFIEDPAGQAFEDAGDDESKRLAEAIKKLPPKYAEVISLTYAHGYNSEKVGKILNISADTVRQRLVRARKKLAELMREKE